MRTHPLRATCLVVVLAACGGGDHNGAASSNAPSEETLRPADEVLSEREASKSLDLSVGEPVDFGDDIRVTVTGMTVGGDDLGPWLAVDVRAENRGDEDASNPLLAIVCDGSDMEGGWQADSTYDLNGTLPAGSYSEGTVHLLVPGDGRFGEARPTCDAPAVVRVRPNSFTVTLTDDKPEEQSADLPIEDALLVSLNAGSQ